MKIDNFDSDSVQNIDVMQSVATAFSSIEDAIIEANALKHDSVDSALFAKCSEQKMVFNSLSEMKHTLNKIAQIRAVKPLVKRLYPLVFDRHDIVVNYPDWINRMLGGDVPEFIVIKSEVGGKEVWLLIDRATWNNFWDDNFTGEIEIDPDDLPF